MQVLLVLFLSCSLSLAQTILTAEYFWDNDPGEGSGTVLSVAAADSVTSGAIVPPGAFAGWHTLYVRYQSDAGLWSKPSGKHIYLIVPSAPGTTEILTQAETLVNGVHVADIDVADGVQTGLSEVLTGLGLPVGLHLVSVRYTTDGGRVSEAQGDYFYYIPETVPGVDQLLTQAQVRINGQITFTTDLPDDTLLAFSDVLLLDSLETGLHEVSVSFESNHAGLSPAQGSFLYYFSPDTEYVEHQIVEAIIALNDIPVGTLDLPDSSVAGQGAALGTDTLPSGVHKLGLAFRDERGVESHLESGYFFLFDPHVAQDSVYLTAAEYFINEDPGIGNGVSLLPVDGQFDQQIESFTDTLSGLPLGVFIAGFRVRDNHGNWSGTEIDTFYIAPLLTITSSGNDIVLHWIPGENGNALMHVERALTTGGPFTEIGSTSNVTYTDFGILTTQDKAFYQVRQDLSVLANFRLPTRSSNAR
ncbi:MAG: hypothetical protein H6505_02125 [Calditrichaeota bacterium]|nr:hypothetical protein [Calditrichota bacterium]